ncbi:MAG: MFS transporter [Erythrobacter sp.]|uniref:MFS transporter n=1 Tax=Erythrobacter sp. TaxID=1042 RepID=UPI00261F1FA3|nr:MFS transporter [Erythrobacter sp.]MDJ0979707.1 MFS transporter [Erythrobacter sp.]
MASATDRNSAYDWYVVGVLFTVSVLGYIDRVILSFLVEPIKAELQLSDAQLGAVIGLAFAALYVMGGILLGRLLDKGNRVLILTTSIIVWSVATGATGFATGFAVLFIARMFVGVGEAGLNPAAIGIISNRFSEANVQKPIGIFTMGLYVGGGLAMLLGGQLLSFFEGARDYSLPLIGAAEPWRLVFVILAFPGLILAGLMLLSVRDGDRSTNGGQSGEAGSAKGAALVGGMQFAKQNGLLIALLAVSVVCWSMNNYGLLNWYPAMLMRTYGMSPLLVANTYGPAFLISGICGCIAVSPVLNTLRKRNPQKAVFSLCLVSMGALSVTTFIGPLLPGVPAAVAMAFINLFISAMSVTSVFVLLVAVVPQHLRGLYTGLYLALVNLTGGAFGSVFVGLFTDYIFGEQGLNYSISMIALLFGPVAAFLMFKASRISVKVE